MVRFYVKRPRFYGTKNPSNCKPEICTKFSTTFCVESLLQSDSYARTLFSKLSNRAWTINFSFLVSSESIKWVLELKLWMDEPQDETRNYRGRSKGCQKQKPQLVFWFVGRWLLWNFVLPLNCRRGARVGGGARVLVSVEAVKLIKRGVSMFLLIFLIVALVWKKATIKNINNNINKK